MDQFLCKNRILIIKSKKKAIEKGYFTKTVGILKFFDKIARDIDWHFADIFSRSPCFRKSLLYT